MSVKVDPNVMKDLEAFGLKDAKKCYHCGNCYGNLSTLHPREISSREKFVRYIQLGQKEKILQSPETLALLTTAGIAH